MDTVVSAVSLQAAMKEATAHPLRLDWIVLRPAIYAEIDLSSAFVRSHQQCMNWGADFSIRHKSKALLWCQQWQARVLYAAQNHNKLTNMQEQAQDTQQYCVNRSWV